MPFQVPSLGGQQVFGLAVEVRPHPNPPAMQLDAYQGLNGQVSQFGGTRGGRISVTGRLVDVDIPSVNNDLATIISFDDGIARTLVDCEGNAYFNCVFAHLQAPKPAIPCLDGWLKEYTVEFVVLSG